jgi:hypothetical protein
MRLPNAHQVVIDREKITEYLLNPAHRYGTSKARFFCQFGFELTAWEILAEALREHARLNEVTKVTETRFGPRYEIGGELRAPDGSAPMVCTVWQLDHGRVAPRLITAYPFKRQGEMSHD